MKTKFLILFIIIPIILTAQENKYELFWNFKLNENFTVEKYTTQTIIKNGQVIKEREIRDYIKLVPIFYTTNNYFLLRGKYFSYQRDLNSDSPFQLNEIYDLNFYMNKQGYYIVPEGYIMPTIRNIPVFPNEKITAGTFWREKGIEIMEFNPPITIPVDVSYQFVGIDKEKFGFETAKISYSYIMNHIVNHLYTDIPNKIYGNSFSTLWYDLNNNLPIYIENIYDIAFVYPEGTIIEYRGDLKGYYNTENIKTNTESLKDKITTEMKHKVPDINVKKIEEGVKVEFGDIYFEYKSSKLTDEAKEKLDKIGDVIKKYNDCEVIIKGHTDDIGSEQYNQRLSEERAKSVLNYLLKKGYLNEKKSSYKGLGEKEPVYDNSTPEGRKKNRRVEIIIIP